MMERKGRANRRLTPQSPSIEAEPRHYKVAFMAPQLSMGVANHLLN
jgi:hypothetical protein